MLSRKFADFKQSIKNFWKRKSPAEFFIALMALSFFVYLIFYTIYGKARFVDILFLRCDDLFMDFFNSVRDASQGSGVYTDRHVIYPPMANLIYLLCSRFIPSAYGNSLWYDRHSWVEYPEAIFFIFFMTLLLSLMLFIVMHAALKGTSKQKVLFALFAVINVPVLYMMERGNIILFCLTSLAIYAFTYNSENKFYRELGLLSLAFAFSLKLYPVVFGWVLLTDKRFKEAIRCAIYGVLMLILPSFFFGGPACFIQIFKNITSFSSGGSTNSITVISGYTGIPSNILNALAFLWCVVCGICFLISPYIYKDRWKTWTLGVATILCYPSLTSVYSWSFLLIPLVLLFNLKKMRKKDWFFFGIISSMFLFTIWRFNFYLSVNSFLIYPLTAILSVTSVADTVICGVRKYKGYRKNKLQAV